MSELPEKRRNLQHNDQPPKRVKTEQSINERDEKGDKSSRSDGDQTRDFRSSKEMQMYPYGNYPKYYENRRGKGKADRRLDVLDAELFRDKKVLDIGCNSGNFTIALAMRYLPAYVLGIDIDEALVHKAKQNVRMAYSLCDPTKKEWNIDIHMRFHYFPRSMSNLYGYMPMHTPPGFESTEFPFNVKFKAGDWMEEGVEEHVEQYHTVLAMSITKWIQLHHGDDGLKRFFQKTYNCIKPGGALILEPQEFNTFERRAKEDEHMYSVFKSLSFKPEDYEKYLLEHVGFKSVQRLEKLESESKGFDRPIFIYTK